MAEAFLEDIYQYSKTVSRLRYVVELIREHDDHHAVMELDQVIDDVYSLCKKCVELQYENAVFLWNQVKQLNEINEDLVYMGDFIESGILPLMENWIQTLAGISLQIDDEFMLESTACGFLTMKNIRTNLYLHSNNNPMEEARKLVKSYYDPKKNLYAVFGCGLGYHVYALYLESNGSVPITLYDTNWEIIEYAKKYGVLDWIPEDKLDIIVDENALSFLKKSQSVDTGMLFHMSSVRQVKNEMTKERLMEISAYQRSFQKFEKDIQINFWRNVSSGVKEIGELDKRGIKKDIVVVAAGPSLDDSMDRLRLWQKKKTIIAVGTVFKKLIQSGIQPDFVVVMDPQKRTLKQIEGVEQEQIPMIIDYSAYWEFAALYQGPKYMLHSETNRNDIDEYAQKRNWKKFFSGGTVAYMAIELAIYFKASNIYMVGIDLAYPLGTSHATGTMDYRKKNTQHLPVTDGVCGKKVYTDRVFLVYKEQIENRIKKERNISFYNMSRIGARIEGTIENYEERD